MSDLTPELKKEIDSMSYREMLSRNRFEPVGSKYFQGDIGTYFLQVMAEKRKSADHVAASKQVGWER